ncbi:hypothetical protein AAG570_006359 [Ranatra chinensis]|uniref:Uncharacterized protein n=1 Tax=Ranatra chinensis TaxID=642074 RepID=A0ABD0YU27_9HEMI
MKRYQKRKALIVRMDFEDSDREEDDEKCDEEGQIFAGEDLGTSETTQLTDCSQETKPRIVSEGKENGLTTKQAMARRRSSQTMKKNTDIEKQTINKKNIDPVNNYKGKNFSALGSSGYPLEFFKVVYKRNIKIDTIECYLCP